MTAFFSLMVKAILVTVIPLFMVILAFYIKDIDEKLHHPVSVYIN